MVVKVLGAFTKRSLSQQKEQVSLKRQNPENGGLVSADRQASWLSCLQHPVSSKSSTVDFLPGACLVALTYGTGHKACRYSCNARVVKGRRFPAWILT